MTFEEWKEKHNYLIENVAITFFNYGKGVDTKTCYDELEYLLKREFKAGRPKWHKVADDDYPPCENDELKEKISYLKDNLRVARKDRENLQLDVARGLKEFVKDFPATALRYLANEKYVEQLTKAKELILKLSTCLEGHSNNNYEYELLQEVEQFLKEAE